MVVARGVTTWGSFALATTLLLACSSATHPPRAEVDSALPDTRTDTGATDAGADADAGEVGDADASVDADAVVDTGPIVTETCEQPPSTGTPGPAPSLKDAGLYRDFASKTLKSCWVEFTPKYTLWSDGLVKHRYIWIPEGTTVDVTQMDRWTFPVGTRVFKEFALEGGQRVETRIIERTTIGYTMGSYVWNADGTDATYHDEGVSTTVVLNPTAPKADQATHDVPSNAQCHRCHDGEAGKLLGFSAIQLSKPRPGINFKGLAERGFNPVLWKNDPPAVDTGIDYPIPGSPKEAAAFGAWHANCGHCHNTLGEAGGFVTMRLRVAITDAASGVFTVSTDSLRSTTIGIDMQFPTVTPGYTKRVVLGPLGVDQSGVYFRDSQRGNVQQMPPIGTKLKNDALLTAVKGWIEE